MSYTIEFTDQAIADIERLKRTGNTPVIKKIRRLLDELKENPYSGSGKPEQLKYDFIGYWSRRINREHRLIYAVEEKKVVVTVISAYGHYGN